jgi:hypothetical protein
MAHSVLGPNDRGDVAPKAASALPPTREILSVSTTVRRPSTAAAAATSVVTATLVSTLIGCLRHSRSCLFDYIVDIFPAVRPAGRLAGRMPDSSTRLVSLHDPDTRPIAKGRIGKPVEFGYKAQVVDNEDGVVFDYDLREGNPADAGQLAPAIERVIRRVGTPPAAATADRGHGEARVEDQLHSTRRQNRCHTS